MKKTDESVDAGIVRLLSGLAVHEGYTPSHLEGVAFLRASCPLPRQPVIYAPGIFIVAQGQKIGYLNDGVYTYDRDHYLVLSIPLPLECEMPSATPEEPLLALYLNADTVLLEELYSETDELFHSKKMPCGLYTSKAYPAFKNAVFRLLDCLNDPLERRVLGKALFREVLFRVLNSPDGWILRSAVYSNGVCNPVYKVIQRIHADYAGEFDVQTLARTAGMSVSGFYKMFKIVTGLSPVQYIKSLRLHKARLLITQEGLSVSLASARVGYASPSQFSREFKRFFGKSPRAEAGGPARYNETLSAL